MTNLYLLTFHDGEAILSLTTEKEILDELEAGDVLADEFVTDVRKQINLTETEGYLLIRGEIVVPKPVSVVTRWEL